LVCLSFLVCSSDRWVSCCVFGWPFWFVFGSCMTSVVLCPVLAGPGPRRDKEPPLPPFPFLFCSSALYFFSLLPFLFSVSNMLLICAHGRGGKSWHLQRPTGECVARGSGNPQKDENRKRHGWMMKCSFFSTSVQFCCPPSFCACSEKRVGRSFASDEEAEAAARIVQTALSAGVHRGDRLVQGPGSLHTESAGGSRPVLFPRRGRGPISI